MGPKLARVDPPTAPALAAHRAPRTSGIPGKTSSDAAKESNLPSRGLPGPASFEDWMGHQARAAPRMILALPFPGGWREVLRRMDLTRGAPVDHRAVLAVAARFPTDGREPSGPSSSQGMRPSMRGPSQAQILGSSAGGDLILLLMVVGASHPVQPVGSPQVVRALRRRRRTHARPPALRAKPTPARHRTPPGSASSGGTSPRIIQPRSTASGGTR